MELNAFAAYQEAIDYLYRFVDYSLTRNFRNAADKFDLSRMHTFLALLDNPQRRYPVLHVAGTKGKGSTSALAASALQAAGYRVGLYTSPHLMEFTERIQVNGQPISPQELVDLVEQIKPAVSQVERLTTFELTTALGFLHFARKGVEVGVIEVGLGGRLDATNVVDPLVSVITSLSLDHVGVLGDTLAKIAYEKAGIIKPGRPVVLAPQVAEAREVIRATAAERGCRLVEVGEDVFYAGEEHSLDGQILRVGLKDSPPVQLRIPLLGSHQVENAATAYAALQMTRESGLTIPDQAIQAGFQQVSWPGRFELLRREPPLVIDSAHNRDSALRLRQTLDDYLPGKPVILIFGASEDKDVAGILAELLPRVTRVIATQSIHPRAADPKVLADLALQSGCPAVVITPVEQALTSALAQAGDWAVVLATGSLFIAAAVRETWQRMHAESLPVDTAPGEGSEPQNT
jgi:dihydrofolate synthase / folylpolyglutamate synthase